MAKGLFYKIITSEGKGFNKKILDNPIIDHNIPEDYITNANSFAFDTFSTGSYMRYCPTHEYAYISQDVFDKLFANRMFWPTEVAYSGKYEYLGASLIRCEFGDILTYFVRDKENRIIILPAKCFDNGGRKIYSYNYYYERCYELPKRNIKILLTKEEFEADKINKENKFNTKRKENNKKIDEVKAGAPTFSLKTPTFRLIKIVKKTDWISDIKEGDTIYGEIPVIKNTNYGAEGRLHGGMSRTNYVNVYVNNKFARSISPLTFQDLFLNNYKVEEMNG